MDRLRTLKLEHQAQVTHEGKEQPLVSAADQGQESVWTQPRQAPLEVTLGRIQQKWEVGIGSFYQN